MTIPSAIDNQARPALAFRLTVQQEEGVVVRCWSARYWQDEADLFTDHFLGFVN